MGLGKKPVDQTVGYTQSIQAQGSSMRGQKAVANLQQKTVDYLTKLDLEVPDRPTDEFGKPLQPRLPADITRVSLEELGRLFGQFTAMAVYAAAQLGLMDVDHIEGEYEAEQTEAQTGVKGVDGANKEERKYNLETDPGVVAKRREALARRAKKILLGNLVEGYREAAKCLSREMSRRGIESEDR